MDQLAAMRAFARVVETGSFTRAANSLETPKPTISKLLQTLEAHLRTKLLNRTTRRVTVTADGAAYYERVVRLLGEIDELDASMAVSQTRPRGRLRIDMSGGLAERIIIPALPDFFDRYPEIQIDLGVSDRPADLVGDNVDCVLRAGELTDQSLIARRIAELPMITCAAPSYLARHGEPRHPSDLDKDGHRVINYFSARTGRPIPFDFMRDGEACAIDSRYAVALNEGGAYVAAAAAGLGVAQSPLFMVRRHLEDDTLRQVLPDWRCRPMPLHVVYPPNRHLSNRLRVFVDWAVELFAPYNKAGKR